MTPRLDHGRLLEALGIEARVLVGVAHDAPSDGPVPHCPGLTLGETVRHLGGLYRSSLAWITTGKKPAGWQRIPAAGQPRTEFFTAGLRAVLAELTTHDADEPAATWWPADATYGFWRRRLAHETTVHRVDVQGAATVPITPVDPDLAVDGVDEVLTLWFTRRLEMLGVKGTQSATVAVQCGEHTWITRAGPDSTSARWVPERAGAVDATVTGAPMDLYLWLWGRTDPWGRSAAGTREIEMAGSFDAVAQLWALLRLATR